MWLFSHHWSRSILERPLNCAGGARLTVGSGKAAKVRDGLNIPYKDVAWHVSCDRVKRFSVGLKMPIYPEGGVPPRSVLANLKSRYLSANWYRSLFCIARRAKWALLAVLNDVIESH